MIIRKKPLPWLSRYIVAIVWISTVLGGCSQTPSSEPTIAVKKVQYADVKPSEPEAGPEFKIIDHKTTEREVRDFLGAPVDQMRIDEDDPTAYALTYKSHPPYPDAALMVFVRHGTVTNHLQIPGQFSMPAPMPATQRK